MDSKFNTRVEPFDTETTDIVENIKKEMQNRSDAVDTYLSLKAEKAAAIELYTKTIAELEPKIDASREAIDSIEKKIQSFYFQYHKLARANKK